MTRTAMIGPDITKNGLAVHGHAAQGRAVVRTELARAEVVPFLHCNSGTRLPAPGQVSAQHGRRSPFAPQITCACHASGRQNRTPKAPIWRAKAANFGAL